MAGLVNAYTFAQFADAARRGRLAPSVAEASQTGSAAIPPVLGQAMARVLLADVRQRFMTSTAPDGTAWKPLGRSRVNGGDKPLLDTGRLMNSIHAVADSRGITIATTHEAAAIQNFGGTIRGKGKMLAIPLTRAAKRAGSPRRYRGKLSFQPTRKARVFLLMSGKGSRRVGQFLLVDSVTIPKREFMGVSQQGLDDVSELWVDYWAEQGATL